MPKLKTIFICTECHQESPRWSGQCSNCKKWNTLTEDVIDEKQQIEELKKIEKTEVHTLGGRFGNKTEIQRLSSGIKEMDRVLGGGIVIGSLILFTGNPGIGKSTLTLQACGNIAKNGKSVLYISGEESVSQISSRAERIFGKDLPAVGIANLVDTDSIISLVEKQKPDFCVIDSINILSAQGVNGSAGSVSQIRACTEILMHFFKKKNIPLLLIGQVTKDGEMAGPQVLAHLVDSVINLEGEKYHHFRILRGIKNRFGPTSEVGLFEMENNGLKQVENPSKAFLEGRQAGAQGSCITSTIEGTRPFLVEIQALTSYTNFTYPKRITSGIDANRLNILIAVLQKHCGIKLDQLDVFVNTIGGFRINEPAIDLAICACIISSKNKKPLPDNSIFLGEIGLSGEVRQIPFMEKRLKEAEKLGIKSAFIPKQSKKIKSSINLIEIKAVKDLLKYI